MRSLLMVLLTLVVASSPVAAQCSDAEKAKLQEFDRTWGEATTRGDRAALQAFLADDYAATSLLGTVTKATAIDDAVRAAEQSRANAQGAPKVTADNFVITCTPTTAVVTHRNVVVATVNAKEQTSYSRSVHVLEKRGGRWQAVGNTGHAVNDAGQLMYMENEWNEAAKKRDMGWFERHYADDLTEISSRNGARLNKADAIKQMKADKSVLESAELSETNVRMEGNTAIVTGVNRVKGRDEQGKAFDMRVRFTDVFVKRDGRWLVWATQGTVVQ